MSNIHKPIHRATISLNIPAKIGDVILYADSIVQERTNNPSFPTPTSTLAALTAAVSDLHSAGRGRGRGSTPQ